MSTQVLLNNGLRIPRIGLGTYGVKDKQLALKLFDEALKCGYRLIDTGTGYGNESYVGEVIHQKLIEREFQREDLFIETKIAPSQQGTTPTNAAVNDSLNRLKVSYIDLVLIHWPGANKLPQSDPRNRELRAETWRELERFVEAGKIKSIGVSNYTISHIQDLLSYCKVKPTLNQVEFHPKCYQKELLSYCEQSNILLQAYSSLGSAQGNPPGWTVLFHDPVVESIAEKNNRTIAQVLLRWGLQHNCLLIPKTSRIENLKPNLDIFDFSLDQEDMSSLDMLNENKHFCWDPANIV